jgi:hypothetical protein
MHVAKDPQPAVQVVSSTPWQAPPSSWYSWEAQSKHAPVGVTLAQLGEQKASQEGPQALQTHGGDAP